VEAAPTHMTEQAYLDATRDGAGPWALRHEWVNGRAYAMAGGSPRHAAVTTNALGVLLGLCRGRPCRPTNGDQRLHVEATGSYFYPDAMVICGRFEPSSADPDSVVNPVLLVEVLSPSTRDYDRGAKFEHYRRIPSVQHVLFIDPDVHHVVHVARREDGWLWRDLTEGVVSMPEVGELPIAELYADLGALPPATGEEPEG